MKKLLSLLCLALLVSLTGCKDASTSLTNGDEALVTVGKTTITKNDVYSSLKSENGVTAIVTKITSFIVDKEVPVTEEMQKEAQEYLETFKTYLSGDSWKSYLDSMGYESEEQYRDESLLFSVRAEKISEKYVENCFEEINEKYQLRKVQILQLSDGETAAKVQAAIKSGELTFEEALVEYKDKLTTTTFTGKEQVITNTAGLSADAIKNIMAVKENNTVLDQLQYSSDLKKFYVVKVVATDVTLEEGKAEILKISTIANDAMAYFLDKYNFTIYDIDLYNGLKAESSSYIVQD